MESIIKLVHKTLAVAESCTGGLLSSLLTQLPCSSKYFALGVVAYSDNAKESILGLPHHTIEKKGTVSKETAQAMAESAREIAKTDLGIGVTGIAGPGLGLAKKPLGTVFIAVTSHDKTICKKFHFTGNRATIRRKSALKALELLLILCKG